MTRPTITDANGDGHFGYGELLKSDTVDALITQHNEHAAALDTLEEGGGGGGSDFITDDGTTVTIAAPVILSEGTDADNGILSIVGGTAGQTKQVFLQENDVMHTAFEAINLVAFQQATFDTAAAPATAIAGDFEVTSTRAAGANDLTNVAVQAIATGGQTNYSFLSTAGVLRNDDTALLGPTTVDSLIIGSTVPGEDYPFYLNSTNAQSQNMVVISEGTNITPTGTDERQAINAFVQGTINTSSATTGSVNAMGLQVNVSATRSAGTDPLNNIAVQANASGGTNNYSWLSTFGTMRQDGNAVFGVVQADDLTATSSITTEDLDVGAGGGTYYLRKNGQIGGSTADTLALNSSITTFLTLLDSTTTGTAVILNATATGAHKYSVGSIPDASFLPTGFTIYDGTSGYECLHITNGSGGPGNVVILGKLALGASTGPTISSGTGSPEGVLTAPVGSLYTNVSGGASTTLYVKTSGAGNTGWTAK